MSVVGNLKGFLVKNIKHLLIYSKHFMVTKERNMCSTIIYQQKYSRLWMLF